MAEDIILRQCRKCAKDLPIDAFSIHRFWRGGKREAHRLWMCKPCRNMADRQGPGWAASVASRSARLKAYRDKDPAAHKIRKRQSHLRNLAAHNLRSKRWAQQNREKRKLISLACEQARRECGWSKNSRVVREAITDTLESYRIGDQYWDVYESCLIDKPTIDHVHPISKGGSNDANNLCVTSLRNNSSKSDYPLLFWMLKRVRGI